MNESIISSLCAACLMHVAQKCSKFTAQCFWIFNINTPEASLRLNEVHQNSIAIAGHLETSKFRWESHISTCMHLLLSGCKWEPCPAAAAKSARIVLVPELPFPQEHSYLWYDCENSHIRNIYIYVCVCYRIYIYNVCTYVIVFEIRLFPRSTTTISLSNLRGPRARIYAVPPHMSRWPQDHTWCELDSLILNTSIQYYTIWVCLKMGYAPNYSHLVGIMIINHWV